MTDANAKPNPCRLCDSTRWAVRVVEVLADRRTQRTVFFAILVCGDCGQMRNGCPCASPEVEYNPAKGELQCQNCGQRWAMDLPAGFADLVQRVLARLEPPPPEPRAKRLRERLGAEARKVGALVAQRAEARAAKAEAATPLSFDLGFALDTIRGARESAETLEAADSAYCAGCDNEITEADDGHEGHDENCNVAHILDRLDDLQAHLERSGSASTTPISEDDADIDALMAPVCGKCWAAATCYRVGPSGNDFACDAHCDHGGGCGRFKTAKPGAGGRQ